MIWVCLVLVVVAVWGWLRVWVLANELADSRELVAALNRSLMREMDEEWEKQCEVGEEEQGAGSREQEQIGRDFGDECDREARDAEAMRWHAAIVDREGLGSRVEGQGGLA